MRNSFLLVPVLLVMLACHAVALCEGGCSLFRNKRPTFNPPSQDCGGAGAQRPTLNAQRPTPNLKESQRFDSLISGDRYESAENFRKRMSRFPKHYRVKEYENILFLSWREDSCNRNSYAIVTNSLGGWLYSPAPVTPVLLKLDPLWDALRDDPNFRKLCESN